MIMIIIANITIKSDKYSGLMFSCLIDIVGNLLARRIAIKKIYRFISRVWFLMLKSSK